MNKEQFEQIMAELADIKRRVSIIETNMPLQAVTVELASMEGQMVVARCVFCQRSPCACNLLPYHSNTFTFDIPIT